MCEKGGDTCEKGGEVCREGEKASCTFRGDPPPSQSTNYQHSGVYIR